MPEAARPGRLSSSDMPRPPSSAPASAAPPGGRLRVGAVAKVCALALLMTGFTGVVAEVISPHEGGALAHERAADEDVRRDLLAIGWRPPGDSDLALSGRTLAESHGVELLIAQEAFELELPNGTIRGAPPADSATEPAAELVIDELGILPASFVRAIGLRRVVLCGDLAEERLPIPSLPNYRHTLLLDVGASAAFLTRLLHHEVFHFADFADDETVLADPAWAALNPADFHYGDGGRSMRNPDSATPSDGIPGFVTAYATSALEEDKAELFSFLMTDPRALRRRGLHDGVIARKRARLLAIVGALSEDMNDSFWRRLEERRGR